MTSIPFVLSAIAVYMLWGGLNSTLFWSIIGLTVFLLLSNQAVVNSHKMQATGDSALKITKFWAGVSMITSAIVAILSIYGIVISL